MTTVLSKHFFLLLLFCTDLFEAKKKEWIGLSKNYIAVYVNEDLMILFDINQKAPIQESAAETHLHIVPSVSAICSVVLFIHVEWLLPGVVPRFVMNK